VWETREYSVPIHHPKSTNHELASAFLRQLTAVFREPIEYVMVKLLLHMIIICFVAA